MTDMINCDDIKAATLIKESYADGLSLTGALRALVDVFGYVDDDTIAPLMQAFARSRAEVLAAITYYDDFRTRPPGRHVIRLCQAEACQAVGGRALTRHACDKTGLKLGQTSPDGALTLEPIYCLGLCANGPAALIDGQPVAYLDAQSFDTKLAELDE